MWYLFMGQKSLAKPLQGLKTTFQTIKHHSSNFNSDQHLKKKNKKFDAGEECWQLKRSGSNSGQGSAGEAVENERDKEHKRENACKEQRESLNRDSWFYSSSTKKLRRVKGLKP